MLSVAFLYCCAECRYIEYLYAECRMLSVIKLSVVMLSVIKLSIIMLSVVKLSVLMPNVMAPPAGPHLILVEEDFFSCEDTEPFLPDFGQRPPRLEPHHLAPFQNEVRRKRSCRRNFLKNNLG